jgi:hypothetical protein
MESLSADQMQTSGFNFAKEEITSIRSPFHW